MTDHPSTPGRGRLRKQGFAALALALVFLAVALLLRPSPAMDAAAAALGVSGLALLALGTTLLVLHAVLRRQRARAWAHTEISTPPAAADWNVHLLQDLTAQQFTALCVALFEQSGFDSRSEARGADGSIDIWLHSRHTPGPATLARCKYMASGQVGLQELQAIHGAMVLHGLRRATFITNATFTQQAQSFAGAHRILTRDGAGLLTLIERRTGPQQQALLDIACVGDDRHAA
jgi:restriction system protein